MEQSVTVISITNKRMTILIPIFPPIDNRKSPFNMIFEFGYPICIRIESPFTNMGIFAVLKIINQGVASIR